MKKHILRNETEIQRGNRLVVMHGDGTEEEINSFPKLDLSFKGDYALIKIHDDIVITDSLKLVAGTGTYADLAARPDLKRLYSTCKVLTVHYLSAKKRR